MKGMWRVLGVYTTSSSQSKGLMSHWGCQSETRDWAFSRCTSSVNLGHSLSWSVLLQAAKQLIRQRIDLALTTTFGVEVLKLSCVRMGQHSQDMFPCEMVRELEELSLKSRFGDVFASLALVPPVITLGPTLVLSLPIGADLCSIEERTSTIIHRSEPSSDHVRSFQLGCSV